MKHLAALAALCTAAACTYDRMTPPGDSANNVRGIAFAHDSPIKHVVFVIQENRSLNNLFLGYPGATTQAYGYTTKGRKIALRPRDLNTFWDMDHSSVGFFAECDGQGTLPGTKCKMDGWNHEPVSKLPPAPKNAPYSYVPRNQITPYWSMARQYVLAAEMFASDLDGSFVAHQYAVAAYASHAVDFPLSTLWGCEGGPGDTVATLLKNRTDGRRHSCLL